MIGPFRLAPYFSPRPWGSTDLRPWYPEKPSEPIGESWLTGKDCRVNSGQYAGWTLEQLVAAHSAAILGPGDGSPGGGELEAKAFPLLVKLLFPHDKLSVQVHPDDRMAAMVGEPRGKTECWYVLSAEPGAVIALGLRPGTTLDAIRKAVANRTLEELLNWIPVFKDDMFYVDAGTVHAIGPGAVLLETQQSSDVTYRLYDYGRPRELHLESALRALKLETEAGPVLPIHHAGYDELIRERYFIVERYELRTGEERKLENTTSTAHSWIALNGSAMIEVEGADPVKLERGQAVVVPGACLEYRLTARDGVFAGVRAMSPGKATLVGRHGSISSTMGG